MRCYPVDSKAMNCLQLTDLLIGAFARTGGAPIAVEPGLEDKWPGVETKLRLKEKLGTPQLTDAECKHFLAYYTSLRFRKLLV